MTIAQRVFRARTVYIVALAWIVALVLAIAAGVDMDADSPGKLAFVTIGGVIELGTIVFAIMQFGRWVGNRLARPPGRLRRFAKGYVLPVFAAAMSIVLMAYPVMTPTPTAEQMIELQGTVTSVLIHGSGSSRRGDFVVDGRSLLFWADRGYGRLAKGCNVRFFVQAEHGRIKQAYDGSVHAWALEDDGERAETLEAALRRNGNYDIVIVLGGLLIGAIAILVLRANWKNRGRPQA